MEKRLESLMITKSVITITITFMKTIASQIIKSITRSRIDHIWARAEFFSRRSILTRARESRKLFWRV